MAPSGGHFMHQTKILILLPIVDDKDKQLQEKEAELRRMQEMVAAMQQQIKQQSQTSLANLASTN